ncbi:MAG: hypothetical protein PUC33_01255 [Oscillospiraceae bacterium]|nr:hypothetical protein [Oscillospiraceae bacterium]MDD6145619.1 hypothetical protein [Oscillospiraceae bacterium]
MKKISALLFSLLMILALSVNTFAVAGTDDIPAETNTVYFEDGSYMVTEIMTENTARATQTKSGSKVISFYSGDDEIQWSATLRGTFSYTGSSATCTASSITYTIYDSKWKIPTATASKSGNTATGHVVAKKYFLGIATKTVERDITLTCSATGTLS